MALIYIDRLIQRNNFLLTELNMHRVVITAILLAAKFFDDAYYNNAYYSKVGGVLVSEMNGLEVDFLFRINFSLHVSPDIFAKYKAELVSHSINAGLAAPPPPPQFLQQQQQQQQQHQQVVDVPRSMSIPPVYAAPQQATAVPIPMAALSTHHRQPSQIISPSPSHVAVHAAAGGMMPSSDALNANSCHAMYVPSNEHVFPNGTTQQFLQRANSLPQPYPAHSAGRCAAGHGLAHGLAHNPSYSSAPMVSMLSANNGMDQDQYVLVETNQLYPLQTMLVHHHHGMDVNNYHDQNSFHHHQREHSANGEYVVGRDSTLVSGHY
jgi:hypothetical protein